MCVLAQWREYMLMCVLWECVCLAGFFYSAMLSGFYCLHMNIPEHVTLNDFFQSQTASAS